jgi:Na+/melibiose symporter-like transporter
VAVTIPKREVQRSFALNIFNGAIFNFAGRLIDPPLVLTWFVSQLSPSNLLVGLVAPLGQACWFLPQVFVSTHIQRVERKMPIYSLTAVIRVLAWLLLATAVWFVPNQTFVLTSFFLLYSVAWSVAGLAGLSFFDVLAKTIPVRQRGSLFAWRQFLGGVLGLGAGWVVKTVLNHPALPFPRGNAFLFLLYGVTITPALVAFAAIREPPGETAPESVTLAEQLRRARHFLRNDHVYRHYIGSCLALGLADIALPFYGIYAKKVLGAAEGMVGVYLATRVVAQLLFNLPWGWLSNRKGNRIVMQLMSIGSGLTALLGISLVVVVGTLQPQGTWLPYLALPLFFLNGAVLPAKVLSGSNFLLELVSEAERPLYLGLSNTLTGTVVLISGLGGLVVDLFSFAGLFILVLGLCLAAYVLATRLPDTRMESHEGGK